MVLDDLHIGALRTPRVKMAARQFIERNFGANDRMAVVFTRGRGQDAQEFTNNKRLLLAAVDKLQGQKLDSAALGRNEQMLRLQSFGAPTSNVLDPQEQERAYNTRSTLSTLQRVAEWFGGVRGRRKTLLFISEGVDFDISDIIRQQGLPQSPASSILSDMQEAIAATARANVSIYSIDPRGLSTGDEDAIAVGSFAEPENPTSGVRGLTNELRVSQDNLRQLSEETGGFATVNRNDFATAFDRVVRDNSSYYVLAYYPPTSKRDGKFHRIEVKVNRPGLMVRSRRGYTSPRGKPAAAKPQKTGGIAEDLFEVINSPLPTSGITLHAFNTPFKGTAPNASVLFGVEVSGRDLALEPNTKLDVSYMAIDSKSKVFGPINNAITLNLRQETRTVAQQTGFRVLNRLELPPGRYQVRVAARDSGRASFGSVISDLEVPDFYKQPIALSGIALTALGGGAMLTPRVDEGLKEVLPAPPIAARVFAQNDELALFAEVYDNSSSQPHKVDIATRVLTDEGRELFKNEEVRDSSDLQGARGGFGYTARVPLSELPAGMYVLRVEARSRAGATPSATREIQFRVMPRNTNPNR
jgi:VWFA-related protein